MYKKLIRAVQNPIIIRRKLRWYCHKLMHKRWLTEAAQYAEANKISDLLRSGDSAEIPPVTHDLSNLHMEIRVRKPRDVLEIGVGFSTIVMCDALYQNEKYDGVPGKLWTVDTSAHWLANTEEKLPEHLKPFSNRVHGKAEVQLINGQLCHTFQNLPNIVPDMLYLDGPHGREIVGSCNGLGFDEFNGNRRSEVSADPLLYESTLKSSSNFILIVDGRWNNVQFLKGNLKRKYKIREFPLLKRTVFELIE